MTLGHLRSGAPAPSGYWRSCVATASALTPERAIAQAGAADARQCIAARASHSPGNTAILLRDGADVSIRAIARTDSFLLKDFYDRLSATSLYLRFQRAVREVSQAYCESMCSVDMAAEVALVACVSEAARWRVVADARYVVSPGTRDAELAIVVADAWQRRGLGARMLAQLFCCAMSRGIETLFGEALHDNMAVRELATKYGARLHFTRGGTSRISIELRPLVQAHGDQLIKYSDS